MDVYDEILQNLIVLNQWNFIGKSLTLYLTEVHLEARMELEGVLRLQTCLRELIGTLELIWSENIRSDSSATQIVKFFLL